MGSTGWEQTENNLYWCAVVVSIDVSIVCLIAPAAAKRRQSTHAHSSAQISHPRKSQYHRPSNAEEGVDSTFPGRKRTYAYENPNLRIPNPRVQESEDDTPARYLRHRHSAAPSVFRGPSKWAAENPKVSWQRTENQREKNKKSKIQLAEKSSSGNWLRLKLL